MAAKLAALAVLFVATHSIVSEAHATTATVITIEESSENRHMYGGRMCRDQFHMANELSHCQDTVMEMCGREGCRGGRFGFGGRDTEYFRGGRCLGMGGVMGGEGLRPMRPCCQQLRIMDMECRCQGLREMMREQMMKMGRVGSRDMEEMVRNLLSMCGMETGRLRHGDDEAEGIPVGIDG